MTNRERIVELVFEAVDDLNDESGEGTQLERVLETPLLGKSAALDSLGLVGLIVAVEQKITEDLEIVITLADERAMSQERSPFRTLGTLVDYTHALVSEQEDD